MNPIPSETAAIAPDPAPAAPAATVAGEPRVFTQEEVGKLLSKERQETRDKVLREVAQRQPTPAAPAPTSQDSGRAQSNGNQEQPITPSQLERKLAFRDVAIERGWTRSQIARLEPMFERENPQDMAGWASGLEADGFVAPRPQPQGGAQQATMSTLPAVPQQQPTAAGAPQRVPEYGVQENGFIDIFRLSAGDLAKMGRDRIVEEFEKMRSRIRADSGAPRLPAVLRNRGNRT